MTSQHRIRQIRLLGAACALFALVGCADDADMGDTSSEALPASERPATANEGAADQTASPSTGAAVDLDLVTPTQLLVVTAAVDVQVADVGDAVAEVVAIARAHSGIVYDSQVDLGDPQSATGDLVLRLPNAEVDGAIADLAGVGTIVSRSQSTDDVTDQMIDLEARILTARASVDSVRALMEKTTDLNQLVFLESELTSRQTALELLLAQQRNLTSDVALATLTVHLSPAPLPTPIVATGHTDGSGRVAAAFQTGWEGFLNGLVAIAIVLAFATPFLVVALLVVGVGMVIRRVRPPRSRSAAPQPLPAPVEGPHTTEPGSEALANSR